METLAFGLFPNRAAADAAIEQLERRGHDHVVTIHEHVGALVDQDLQVPGTRAWLFAVLGGLFAAVIGGIAGAILFGGRLGVGPGMTGLVAGVAAAAFGGLAAIAGIGLPRRELQRLQRDVAEGRALVTIDVDSKHASAPLQAQLQRCGAIRTGILYGPGLGSTEVTADRRLRP